MYETDIGVSAVRSIDKKIEPITPTCIEALKDDMKEDMGCDLIDLLDALGFIKWHIDTENRTITGEYLLFDSGEGVKYEHDALHFQ